MTVPLFLAPLVASWSSYYGDHQAVSVTVRFVHLAATVVGGGNALATDRFVFRAVRGGDTERAAVLPILHSSHRVVVPALVVIILSGLLMTAADAETFLASNLFWLKIGLVAILLINGGALLAAEAAVSRPGAGGWGRVGAIAGISLCLWIVILFVGTWLTVAA